MAPLYDAWGSVVTDSETIKSCKENLVATRQYWANILASTTNPPPAAAAAAAATATVTINTSVASIPAAEKTSNPGSTMVRPAAIVKEKERDSSVGSQGNLPITNVSASNPVSASTLSSTTNSVVAGPNSKKNLISE